ncbi:hypothetical protein BAE44_0002458 [Dichanthelium oligosanthes]|uniref:Uncharacterized protein n=1 Tax=Dichanthelium oligosanthes TaxID=888268 RepID=A0A1E5WGL4_9POAL|nr:hypothetical protein BAE44_0002458 [Dichanthelium oligosanthes]
MRAAAGYDDQEMSLANTSNSSSVIVNSTSPDEGNKIYLKLCEEYSCDGIICFCCLNQTPRPYCYTVWKECQAACPTCNPKCPPLPATPPAMEAGRPAPLV